MRQLAAAKTPAILFTTDEKDAERNLRGKTDRLEDGVPFYHSYSGPEAEGHRPLPVERRAPAASGPSAELYARIARRYRHPTFNLGTTVVSGVRGPVFERCVKATPFWTLTAFDRASINQEAVFPPVLVLPPYAGHCPTLVRDTIASFLPDHSVHVASWADARHVPLSAGAFGLGEAVESVLDMTALIEGAVHIVAITESCAVAVAAAALMRENNRAPATLTLIGGPIDCSADHSGLAAGATERGLDWFMRTVIAPVPSQFEGSYREVFPGFFTLTGFLTRNFDRSLTDPKDLFLGLIAGDGDDTDGHRAFFEEFLAVMDVPAELMLQWIEAVLINRPFSAELSQDGPSNAAGLLADIPLMTVEAGNDSFGGGGQTHAAHGMTIASTEGYRHTEENVGRFALFSGARWRSSVFPRVADFIANHGRIAIKRHLHEREDLLTFFGLTPDLVARFNSQGFYFSHQLAQLDDTAANLLDRRLGFDGQCLVAQLSRQARLRLAQTDRS